MGRPAYALGASGGDVVRIVANAFAAALAVVAAYYAVVFSAAYISQGHPLDGVGMAFCWVIFLGAGWLAIPKELR